LKFIIDTDNKENTQIFICQKDFINALKKVFPSVSKKDELSYAKLENSLRKTRGHIISDENGLQ
jgi:hypothetical protein